MPPPSSGGVVIHSALKLIEKTQLANKKAFSVDEFHYMGEILSRSFRGRPLLGDPSFHENPLEFLLSDKYLDSLVVSIGERSQKLDPLSDPPAAGLHTTHYSVLDKDGNAVALTVTLNGDYGSGVVTEKYGIALNNEMDDFTSQPGKPNTFGLVQGEQNAIAPRKRMLSAMSPSIVLDPQENVLLVLGSRGGPRIITSVSQVILNVLDHGMSLADALSAPRIHHQALPDSLRHERNALTGPVADSLLSMGHRLSPFGNVGLVIAIRRAGNVWEGMVDPRSSGGVAGY
jgi:gamma-glutamyltranspeptidase/glutathione hydrolase